MVEKQFFMAPAIPKFDGFYDHWAELMENLFRSKEYWSLLEQGIIVAPQTQLQNNSKLQKKARSKIST